MTGYARHENTLEATGKTLAEAMKQVVLGLFDILVDPEEVRPKARKEINLDAKMEDILLHDFLEQLMYLIDHEGFVLSRIEELSTEGNVLHCVLSGDNCAEYEVKETFHSISHADLEQTKDGYKITVKLEH